MVCGWKAWSGLLVPVVKCVGKFPLPERGLLILLLFLPTGSQTLDAWISFLRHSPWHFPEGNLEIIYSLRDAH